jgi:hypothetical protein
MATLQSINSHAKLIIEVSSFEFPEIKDTDDKE